jgi:hypothetical protein
MLRKKLTSVLNILTLKRGISGHARKLKSQFKGQKGIPSI